MGKLSKIFESRLFQKVMGTDKLHSFCTQIEKIGDDVIAYKEGLQKESGGVVNFIDHPGFFENEAVKEASRIPDIFGEFLEEPQVQKTFRAMPEPVSRLILLAFCNSAGAINDVFGRKAEELAHMALDNKILSDAYKICGAKEVKAHSAAAVLNLLKWATSPETRAVPDELASKFCNSEMGCEIFKSVRSYSAGAFLGRILHNRSHKEAVELLKDTPLVSSINLDDQFFESMRKFLPEGLAISVTEMALLHRMKGDVEHYTQAEFSPVFSARTEEDGLIDAIKEAAERALSL